MEEDKNAFLTEQMPEISTVSQHGTLTWLGDATTTKRRKSFVIFFELLR